MAFNPPNVQYKILTLLVHGVEFSTRCISSSTADRNKITAATLMFWVKIFNGAIADIVGQTVQPEIQDGGSKKEVPISRAVLGQNMNFKSCYRTVWHTDARTRRAKLDGLPTIIKSNMAADKPEIVIITVVYLIEVRSQTLMPCFQGSSM
jgi:hypothetical protein